MHLEKRHMHLIRISSSLLIFLVMFNLLLSSSVKGFSNNGVNRMQSLHDKVGVVGYKRKVLAVLDAVLDYDYAGANTKHDPRGKKPGGGGKNP